MTIGILNIEKGSVNITRNERLVPYTENTDVKLGDIIKTLNNAFAEIQTDVYRLSLDINSQLSFTESGGSIKIGADNGTFFLSTHKNISEFIEIYTENTKITLIDGVVVINKKRTYGQDGKTVPVTTVQNITGEVKVETLESGKVVDIPSGDKVTITDNKVGQTTALDPKLFEDSFISSNLEKEIEAGRNLASTSDSIPPIATILYPEEDSIINEKNIIVKFKINEDGFYEKSKNEWIEIFANQTIDYPVELQVGINKLEIDLKDKFENALDKEFFVTYKKPEVAESEEPITPATPEESCTINPNKSTESTVSWEVNGECSLHSGYKVVWNSAGEPTYPENNDGYNNIDDISIMESTIDPGSWYVRVCLFDGTTCVAYSEELEGTFN